MVSYYLILALNKLVVLMNLYFSCSIVLILVLKAGNLV